MQDLWPLSFGGSVLLRNSDVSPLAHDEGVRFEVKMVENQKLFIFLVGKDLKAVLYEYENPQTFSSGYRQWF